MNILKKYLPIDIVNLIYDYVYRSVYYDVVQEMVKLERFTSCHYNLAHCYCGRT